MAQGRWLVAPLLGLRRAPTVLSQIRASKESGHSQVLPNRPVPEAVADFSSHAPKSDRHLARWLLISEPERKLHHNEPGCYFMVGDSLVNPGPAG